MTTAVIFLLVFVAGFSVGWYARAWKMRLDAEAQKPSKWTDHIVTAAFVILVLGFLGNIIYTKVDNHGRDERIAAAKNEAINSNTALTECISKWAKRNSEVTALRSDATEKRDEALVASKVALSHLIDLRIIQHVDDSPAVQKVAEEYMKQTKNYVDASMELNRIRKQNPIPNFEDYCTKVPHSSKSDTK